MSNCYDTYIYAFMHSRMHLSRILYSSICIYLKNIIYNLYFFYFYIFIYFFSYYFYILYTVLHALYTFIHIIIFTHARRYTIEDKMFCLGIYRRSRSCYNFISKFLSCPSYNTLNTQLNRISIDTGYNNIILKYLTLSAKKDLKDLCIVLAWDEKSIQPALTFDVKNNKLIGFEKRKKR